MPGAGDGDDTMLSQQQWQWFADNHRKVRRWSWNALTILILIYGALILKTIWDKGKAPIPYQPATNYREQFGCRAKLEAFDMGPFGGNTPPKPGFYEDANLFKLERHETGMLDVEALRHSPECIGAMLVDELDNPNPLVFLLYDKTKGRVVYRLARIDDVLKR